LQFWDPLTIHGSQPSGNVTGGTLGVLRRPDGKTQVTINGAPVYRFIDDQAGTVKGDGVNDAFGGQDFSWHVATAAGGSSSSSPRGSGGSGY
jgi:predicted lipoprotein with Yx(FWY)xxD motif